VASAQRQFDVFVLRYVPSVLEDRFINIGILLSERGEAGFSDSRFLRDWQQVRSFDPDADVEMLASLAREIKEGWKQPTERAELLRRMLEFSGAAQLSLAETVVTDDPVEELERLASTLHRQKLEL